MADKIFPSPPPSGRPRDLQLKLAIEQEVRKFARESNSFAELSIERVAKRAGCSKATIYRWWRTKSHLIRDVCFSGVVGAPDTGSLKEDLSAIARNHFEAISQFASPAIVAGMWAELVQNFASQGGDAPVEDCPLAEQTVKALGIAFEQARVRGEWAGPADVHRACEVIFGTLFCKVLGRMTEATEDDVDFVANQVLYAAATEKSA